jgi:hypothetical protein
MPKLDHFQIHVLSAKEKQPQGPIAVFVRPSFFSLELPHEQQIKQGEDK